MRRLLIALIGWALLTVAAAAEERITEFVSEATINKDGSLDVTETITVVVEGKEIRHGLLRDFPTRYKDRTGRAVSVGFEVLSIQRDGRDEPYALEPMSNGQRIRIGDKDVFLDFGSHTYRIAYNTTRQLGFFETHDELYWNVTGNRWSFAIDRTEAVIHLPPGAEIVQHAAYAGAEGEVGTDYRVTQGAGTTYRATTTRRLVPGEGFTVAVGFTRGVVQPPPNTEAGDGRDSDEPGNASIIAAALKMILFVLIPIF